MISAISFQGRWSRSGLPALVCALGLLGAAGCSRTAEDELAYRQAMEAERQVRESIRQTLNGEPEDAAAIRMVREQGSPDGKGTMEQWVKRFTDAEKGTVLFPRWYAERRGVGRFEVRHVYTLLMDDGRVEERGHAWSADLALKLVEGPQTLVARKVGSEGPGSSRVRGQQPPPPTGLIQD